MVLSLGLLMCLAAQEAPVIESVRLKPCLMIRGEVGTTNEVLYADRLGPNQWHVLTNMVVASSTYGVIDPTPLPMQRFYQVVGVRQPPRLCFIGGCLRIRATVGTTNRIFYKYARWPWDDWGVLTNLVVTASPYEFLDVEVSRLERLYVVALAPEPLEPVLDTNRWVWTPAGSFTMGSPATEKDRGSDEGPQTTVTLTRGFWMGRYEVTQGEYLAVMRSNPSGFKWDLNLPVERVSWYDVTDYCGELTERERQAGRLPGGWEYRLPTEAEWEYACRAGTTARFSYGDDLDYSQLGNHAWYWANSSRQTHSVGWKLPNPWGLHDMHGNLWEWCLDWYGTYPGGSVCNPKGPSSGLGRVIRGGGWYGRASFCRSAYRNDFEPARRDVAVGFRVVVAPVAPLCAPGGLAASNVTTNSFSAQWGAVAGAVGYLVDVSTVSDFTTLLPGWNGKDVGAATTVQVTDLSLDISYYVRVKAYKSATDQGPYSATLEVRTSEISGLVWIPPGIFTMGSPTSEQDAESNEGPQTEVYLSRGFFLSRYEVTQGEYEAVTGGNPSYFKGDPNLPVEQVTWVDAMDYCAKLTQRERDAGRLPVSWEYRLPTEAQWEYACRAGTTTRFCWGDDPGYSELGGYAWYRGNSGGKTHPVGQKQPNYWGLYDMHGNVWEWCLDWYGTYSGGSVTDPIGPSTGWDRVYRGGSWCDGGWFCRSAFRNYFWPVYRHSYLGFRVALVQVP